MLEGISQLSIPFDRNLCPCTANVHRSSRRGFRDFLLHLFGALSLPLLGLRQALPPISPQLNRNMVLW